jgi:uncharacterized oxidoreductase
MRTTWAHRPLRRDGGGARPGLHPLRQRAVAAGGRALGGGDGRYGTNPFCVGVPLPGREPFVLDFATSRVAQGKMRVAHNEGPAGRSGYLIDEKGRPTTDPGVVVVPQPGGMFGALLPFGEHKGYGMAVACELLGGALTGSGTWHRPGGQPRAVINGMFTIMVDPRKLGTQAEFEREALAFVDWLKQSPPAPDTTACCWRASRNAQARREREADGIALDDQTWAEIVARRRQGRRPRRLTDLPRHSRGRFQRWKLGSRGRPAARSPSSWW